MKFKNETREVVVLPILNDNLPSDKIIFRNDEIKEVPDRAIGSANLHGLTPIKDDKVEAEESSIAEVKVETKQIKVKKLKKSRGRK